MIYNPPGQNDVENYIDEKVFDTHWLEDLVFEQEYKDPSPLKKIFLQWIFKKFERRLSHEQSASTNRYKSSSVDEKLSETKVSEMKLALRNDPEVQNLVRSIDERDQIQILEFGKEPAVQISRFSDQILSNMRTTKVEDSGELLKQLGKIMDKFDKKDFEKTSGGIFRQAF